MRLAPRLAAATLLVIAQVALGANLIDGGDGKTKPQGGGNGSVTGTKKPSPAPQPPSGKPAAASGSGKPAAGSPTAPAPASATPLPPPSDPAPVGDDGLLRDFTAFSAIGASMRLPAGATVNRITGEEFPAWEVLSGGGPEWRLRVEQVWAPDPAADCAKQARNALQSLGAGGAQVKVLSERPGTVSG